MYTSTGARTLRPGIDSVSLWWTAAPVCSVSPHSGICAHSLTTICLPVVFKPNLYQVTTFETFQICLASKAVVLTAVDLLAPLAFVALKAHPTRVGSEDAVARRARS